MTREQETELIIAAKAGDNGAMEALLVQHNRWIWRTAVRAKTRSNAIDHDDLVQIGRMAMIRAVRKFDLSLGNRLTTYAYTAVIKAVQSTCLQDGLIHLPGMVKHTQGYKAGGKDDVDRAWGAASLDYDRHDDTGRILGKDLPDTYDMFEEIERGESIRLVRRLVAFLPDPEREIMTRRLAGETLQVIGDDFGLSKEWIRQMSARAIAMMRDDLNREKPRKVRRRPFKRGNGKRLRRHDAA